MKKMTQRPLFALIPLTLCLWASHAQAGRPLAVDDASVSDKGTGLVEIWLNRDAQRSNTMNIAPSFSPIEGVEIGASYAKTRAIGKVEQTIEAKWRITPSQDNGCNIASTLGTAHEINVGSSPYLIGIVTCNSKNGSVHVNLTRRHDVTDGTYNSWGVAFERPMGSITPHIEVFGDQGQKATLQMGARTQIREGLQLDSTIGRDRQNRANVSPWA
jgi:hypothetical protein